MCHFHWHCCRYFSDVLLQVNNGPQVTDIYLTFEVFPGEVVKSRLTKRSCNLQNSLVFWDYICWEHLRHHSQLFTVQMSWVELAWILFCSGWNVVLTDVTWQLEMWQLIISLSAQNLRSFLENNICNYLCHNSWIPKLP